MSLSKTNGGKKELNSLQVVTEPVATESAFNTKLAVLVSMLMMSTWLTYDMPPKHTTALLVLMFLSPIHAGECAGHHSSLLF